MLKCITYVVLKIFSLHILLFQSIKTAFNTYKVLFQMVMLAYLNTNFQIVFLVYSGTETDTECK